VVQLVMGDLRCDHNGTIGHGGTMVMGDLRFGHEGSIGHGGTIGLGAKL
jgi:hypothetical protein